MVKSLRQTINEYAPPPLPPTPIPAAPARIKKCMYYVGRRRHKVDMTRGSAPVAKRTRESRVHMVEGYEMHG